MSLLSHPLLKKKGDEYHEKNIGIIDRVLRVIFAIVVGVLYFAGFISVTAAFILGILAFIMLVTSIVAFCPLYVPLGISTVKNDGK